MKNMIIAFILTLALIGQGCDQNNEKMETYNFKGFFTIDYLKDSEIEVQSPVVATATTWVKIVSPDYKLDQTTGNVISGFSVLIEMGASYTYENIDSCKDTSVYTGPCLLAKTIADYTQGEVTKKYSEINGCPVITFDFKTAESSQKINNLLGFVTNTQTEKSCTPYSVVITYNKNYGNLQILNNILESFTVNK